MRETEDLQAVSDKLMALRSAINPTKHQFVWDEMTRLAGDIRRLAPRDDPDYVIMPRHLSPEVIAACVGGGVTSDQINHIYSLVKAAVSLPAGDHK